jgi:uncharacterized protein (DUF697 family)
MKHEEKFKFPKLPKFPPNFPKLSLPKLPGVEQAVEKALAKLTGWFTVDEDQATAILTRLRAELPTTEVWLVGKPQTGKSSIVRALTGVGAEIVGQGFRPHTAHTQRYSYPTADVPLLIFTDTVGLGENQAETTAVIQELQQQLQPVPTQQSALDIENIETGQPYETTAEASQSVLPAVRPAAKVLVLTIRAGDFATDSLRQIVTALRQAHPHVPCLLAITCLHQLYPAGIDHPAYPPKFPELERVVAAIQADFVPLVDRVVLIDFTLETDGFTPMFYGREAFVEQLSELLPESEARLINQLLVTDIAGTQLGNLYREAGRRYILPFALMAGTLAAVPLPFATMPVLTTLQTTLVGLLGRLYGQNLTPAQAGGLVSTIAGGFIAQMIGQQLVKFIPGLGSVIAASWAGAYTWALGETACIYFGDLMGGKTPDPDKLKAIMRSTFTAAQSQFKQSTFKQSSSSGTLPEQSPREPSSGSETPI